MRIGRTADSGDPQIPRAAYTKIGSAADDAAPATAYRRTTRSRRERMTHKAPGAAIVAVLVAALVAGCGGSRATFTKQTLGFTESQNDDSLSFVDNPPTSSSKGDEPTLSKGDQLTFTADLIDGSKKDVGDLDVTCTITATTTGSFDDSRAECLGTATIPGGTLTLSVGGKAFGAGATNGAIVGGTGDYSGATGTFTSSDESRTDRPSQDSFQLFVPQQ
jgi:hypothetical protein